MCSFWAANTHERFFVCGFLFVIPHVSWGIVSFWQHIPIALFVLFGLQIHTSVFFSRFFGLWFHTANAGLFFSIWVCREHQLSNVKQFVVICWDLERCTYWYSDWSIQMDKLPFGLVLFPPRVLDQSYSGVCVFIVSACGHRKTKFSKKQLSCGARFSQKTFCVECHSRVTKPHDTDCLDFTDTSERAALWQQ